MGDFFGGGGTTQNTIVNPAGLPDILGPFGSKTAGQINQMPVLGFDAAGTSAITQTMQQLFNDIMSSSLTSSQTFEEMNNKFTPFLNILQAAITGQTSPELVPQLRQARDDLRREQSQANQQILENASRLGGKRQFGTERLLAQSAQDFGRADAALEPTFQAEIIRNFLPILKGLTEMRFSDLQSQRQLGQNAQQQAFGFNAPSLGKQLTDMNLVRQGTNLGSQSSGVSRTTGPGLGASIISGFTGAATQTAGTNLGNRFFT